MTEPSFDEMRHWGFVFKILPRLFLEPPPEGHVDLRTAPRAVVDQVLRDAWRSMPPGDDRSCPRACVVDAGGARGIGVLMPAPTSSPQAYFALWFEHGGHGHLFTWERPMEGLDGAVLGATSLETMHTNYGHNPGERSFEAFLAAVTRVTGVPFRVTEHATVPMSALRQHREPATVGSKIRDVFLGLVVLAFVALAVAAVYFSM